MSKRCPRCNETKPLSDFHRKKTTKDGLCCWCKECNCANARGWRNNNLEKHRERARKYGNLHKEARATRSKRWRQKNPERYKLRRDAWRVENRERDRLLKTLDNHRRRGAQAEADEVKIIRRDPCAYCGDPGGTVDHIVPIIDGGPGDWANIAGACLSCNSAKSTMSLLTFLLKRCESRHGGVNWKPEGIGVMR